jgi:hypothetical protein
MTARTASQALRAMPARTVVPARKAPMAKMAIKAFLVLRVFKASTVPLATRALTAMPAIQGCRAREGPTAQTGRPDPLARTVWPARQAILAIEARRVLRGFTASFLVHFAACPAAAKLPWLCGRVAFRTLIVPRLFFSTS